MNFTRSEIEHEPAVFNNAHNPGAESFELEVESHQISTWDYQFKLWINGELKATFKSFDGLKKRAEKIINDNDLKRVFYI